MDPIEFFAFKCNFLDKLENWNHTVKYGAPNKRKTVHSN